MKSPRFEDTIAAVTIGLLAFAQAFSLLGSIHDFSWLTTLSHDTAYQTERFLLNMHYPAFRAVTTAPLDYGSELFYLIPLARIYDWVTGVQDPLHAFHVLVSVHILCAAAGLGIMYLLFRRESFPRVGLAVVVIVALSPLYTQWMGSIKPDANVVLFFLALGLYEIRTFRATHTRHHLYAAILCAGAACAVKWWGFFLIFPLVGVVRSLERQQIVVVPPRSLVISAGIASATLFSVFALNLPFTLEVVKFLLMFGLSKVIGAVILLGVLTVVLFLSRRVRTLLLPAVGVSAATVAAYLVLNLPYLLSSLAPGSLWYYSKYLLVAPHNLRESGAEPGGPLINAYKWFADAQVSGFMDWLVLASLGAALLHFVRGKRLRAGGLDADVFWFVCPFLFFLFLFIQKKNWATQAMLQPFLLGFIAVVLTDFISKMARGRLAATLLLVLLGGAHVLYGNLQPGAASSLGFYANVRAIPNVVREFERLSSSLKSIPCRPVLYSCERVLPLPDDASHVVLDAGECGVRGLEGFRNHCDYLVVRSDMQSFPVWTSSFREIKAVTIPEHSDGLSTKRYTFVIYQR